MEEYKKKYEEALGRARTFSQRWQGIEATDSELALQELKEIFPELKESEDERIRKWIVDELKDSLHTIEALYSGDYDNRDKDDIIREGYLRKALAWLEKQGEQNEINLVEILKHYPRETELYSPLYGKLWLAEVDEEHEIITCYKHHLNEGCVRAILEQEDTVSFYSNGTTGLPDFSISKDCMLFLYSEKLGEQKSTDKVEPKFKVGDVIRNKWSNKTKTIIAIDNYQYTVDDGMPAQPFKVNINAQDNWELVKENPAWSEEDEKIVNSILSNLKYFDYWDEELKKKVRPKEIIKDMEWLKSLKERMKGE